MTSRTPFALLLCALSVFAAPRVAAQCVSLTTPGSAYTQSFNTLSNTAGSTTNNLTITGWFMTETGGGARDNEQYAVDTGGSNTGDTFSYGAAANAERALGGLQSGTLIPVIGACFTNNTGSTIESLDIAYTGEQWRIANTAAARDDRLDFQYSLTATSLTTGTWTDVNALDFTNPIKTAGVAGALDGNNAANRTAIVQSIPALSIANGATFWIRWNDLNASGADDGLSVDDFSLTPQGAGPVVPALSINDVSLSENDPPGTTTFSFSVTLSAPAGPGGVTFDIATADGTAQDGNPLGDDTDYVANSLTGQTIPAGSTGPYNFDVTVNRDTAVEANETFFVNVTNITGANAGDTQGQGSILNDDFTITPIHDIQGPGASSPITGASVTTRGIVTGVKGNGFFIQEPDATVDADPATSEGVFVFTSAAPPAAAALGNLVQVTATVIEFVPAQDPLQPPLTELSSPTITQLSTGNPLPAPVALTATFPDPAGPYDQLERLEGMRVSVASLTVVAPTGGNVNEPNATSTSTGDFFGVVTGLPRPFREPGIQSPDPAPAGSSIPPVPRWDANPEALRVDNGLTGSPVLNVSTGAVVTGLVGPLDYGFRRYTILPEPAPTPVPVVTGGMTQTSSTAATGREFTVGGYNLERFFDTVADAGVDDAVLTPAAFETRLNKASLGIRNYLGMPDIVGIVEIENLTTLQTLATRINDDAVAASQPDPQYVGYLVEGNDIGGIDVGFLVKTSIVAGATPRVTVNAVVQELDGTLFVNPDASTETLHDRPPLRLDAVVNHPNGASFPVTVIVVHNRSLNDAESEDPGSNGWPTKGTRVRAKRLAQAEDIANLIQARQTGDPGESIIVLGDFNAFEFNDGYVDAMNVITGTPPPDNETAVAGDGVDLVNPDLDNLFDTPPPAERYSFVFGGQAQNLDHLLVNQALIGGTVARRLEHPRINSDFPEVDRNDPTTARRLADHDPLVGFFEVAAFAASDISITKTDNVDPVNAGQNFFYTLTVDNAGPDAADNVSWSDTLPAGTTFVSLSAPGGWSCTTPAVGANGTVTCSIASLGVGSAAFNLTVAIDAAMASGSTLSNTATVTTTTVDPNGANNSDTETTTVLTSADLLLSKTDTPDPVNAGSNLSYQITLTNNGPSIAAGTTFSDTLPAGTTFVSLSTTGPWSCTTPAVGAGGTISCTNPGFGVTVDFFTIVVNVDPALAAGTVLTNTATLASTTTDPNPANNSATATTTIDAGSADVSVTKTDSPDPVNAGSDLTYTITVANAGPSNATTVALSDTLPAGTTFVSLSAPAGWSCTTPAVGAGGAVNCSIASLGITSGVFTLTVTTDPALLAGTVLNNSATVTSATADPNDANNSALSATTVTATADLLLSKTDTPDPADAGSTISYQLTLTNNGPSNAAGATLSDALPAGTTFVSLSTTGPWSCTTPAVGANGSIECTNASFGVTVDFFTVVVQVDPGLPTGTVLTNTATLSSTTTDPNPANNSSTATTTVGTGSADISVVKTDAPDPVNAGTGLTYTITVTNAGPSNATTVALSDALPTGTTFLSLAAPAGWTCTTPAVGANGPVDCSIASLGITSAVFTLTVNTDAALLAGTVLSNTATATSATSDPNPANNSSTATTTIGTGSADISVIKTDAPDPVNAGTGLTYTITVTNAGPGNATTVALSDALPTGTTFLSLAAPAGWTCTTPAVGANGSVDCSIASLGITSAVFTLTVKTDAALLAGAVLSNTATATSATSDPNPANNSSTATTTIGTGSADISVVKTDAPDPVNAGSNLTYTITVTNAGPSNATTVALSDALPTGTTFLSLAAPAGWTCTTPAVGANGSVDCSIASLGITSAVFTLTVNTDAALLAGDVLSNTATTTSATSDPNPADNSSTATTTIGTGSADISVVKTDAPDPVSAGSNLTYTITVTNAGPSNATTVALADTLPTGTTFASLVAPAGWTCTTPAVGATGTIDCSIASLGITSAVFTLAVNTDPALLDGTVLTNTATVTSATTDPNAANNSAVATTTVNASADLMLSKTDTPDPVDAGSTISYQLTLTNNGPSHAADATLSDTLPTGTTFVSLSTTGSWSCTTPAVGATGTIDCTNASFGVTVDFFTVVVQVDPGLTSGTVLTNTATLASTTTDPNPANNSSTATTTVGIGSADISITKSVSPDPVNAGANLTYTITVTNAGPTDAASTEMFDTLPAGTTFVSLDAPADWTCTTPAVDSPGLVSCTIPSLGSTSAVFTLTVRVAADTPSGTEISNTAAVSSTTPDPNTGDESAIATASVLSPANVSGTKSVAGTFEPNGTITYTIVLTNDGPSTQQDNAGDEFIDILPASLTLVSANATSGTALATVATNTVTWNGSIASGASVTITIEAVIRPDTLSGTTVSNQGTIAYDADGNGSNESSRPTDSPAAGGASDPTEFIVGAGPAIVAGVPTLDEYALMALAALLAAIAMMTLKR